MPSCCCDGRSRRRSQPGDIPQLKRLDTRECSACHVSGVQGSVRSRPNYDGIDLSGLSNLQSANMMWDFIPRLRDTTAMKIVIKGILTQEDARLCVGRRWTDRLQPWRARR